MSRSRALVATVAITLLAACSSPATRRAAVHPFDEIRSGEVTIERDSTDPSRAVLHVTTSEPAICAVVWGVDENFGRFNNSLSMNGTGITQHDVILPRVEPGVTYRYVLQGTTADGTLYRSDIGSFRIDSPPPSTSSEIAPPGPDITSRATVTAFSSEFSSAFAATNAIDGDTTTEWASRGDGDNGSITLDLGAPTDISGAEFVTRAMADGTAVTTTFTVSVDGGPDLGPFPAGTVAQPQLATFGAHGRVLRFDIDRSTGGNVGAVEIRVYG